MSFEFRASNPSDTPRLISLFQNALGMHPGSPGLDPRCLAWKYWDERRDWNGPRSYVLTKDGVIMAHAGIWPLVLGTRDRPVQGIQMIDWVAAHETAGAGLALLRRLAGMFDFVYSIGGSDMTKKLLPALGFRVCTSAWRAARPVRPMAQILNYPEKNWRLIPRLLRNCWWSIAPSERRDLPWTAHPISPEELLTTGAELSYSSRSSVFFEYMERCPIANFGLWRILESGKPIGFFSLAVVRTQARVGGIWLREAKKEYWRVAYSVAQRTARSMSGVFEILAGGSKGPSGEAAARAGLRIRSELPVFVLETKGKPSIPDDFEFQLLDDDSAFRDSGADLYLT